MTEWKVGQRGVTPATKLPWIPTYKEFIKLDPKEQSGIYNAMHSKLQDAGLMKSKGEGGE